MSSCSTILNSGYTGFDSVTQVYDLDFTGLANGSSIDITVGSVERPDYFNQGNVNFGDVHVTNSQQSNVDVIQLLKLDEVNFNELSLIKIDVQGFETYVIEGAKETIQKHRPFIFVEIEEEQLEKYGFSEGDLIKQIEELNYTVKRFQVGIPYQTRSGVCLDCVCIPNEKFESQDWIIK